MPSSKPSERSPMNPPMPRLAAMMRWHGTTRGTGFAPQAPPTARGEYLVQALGGAPGASSHLLATLAEANCLVMVPSEAEQIRTGEIVDVAFLAQRG